MDAGAVIRLAALLLVLPLLSLLGREARAEVLEISRCSGALACEITTRPPNPVTPDPNDGKLTVWNERQNVILQQDLVIDRVADPESPFVIRRSDGRYAIRAGTLVSSHYLQWDPARDSASHVSATIRLDQPIFGFIIGDRNLFDSDAELGLPGLDYSDFWLRGLEDGDWTRMRDDTVEISWWAGSPGDWTRLITAGALIGSPWGRNTRPARAALADSGKRAALSTQADAP